MSSQDTVLMAKDVEFRKSARIVESPDKPCYICELEQEILTLTPFEVLEVTAFVSALKIERTLAL